MGSSFGRIFTHGSLSLPTSCQKRTNVAVLRGLDKFPDVAPNHLRYASRKREELNEDGEAEAEGGSHATPHLGHWGGGCCLGRGKNKRKAFFSRSLFRVHSERGYPPSRTNLFRPFAALLLARQTSCCVAPLVYPRPPYTPNTHVHTLAHPTYLTPHNLQFLLFSSLIILIVSYAVVSLSRRRRRRFRGRRRQCSTEHQSPGISLPRLQDHQPGRGEGGKGPAQRIQPLRRRQLQPSHPRPDSG